MLFYYYSAIQIEPDSPEALDGLANQLIGFAEVLENDGKTEEALSESRAYL